MKWAIALVVLLTFIAAAIMLETWRSEAVWPNETAEAEGKNTVVWSMEGGYVEMGFRRDGFVVWRKWEGVGK